MTLSTVLGLFIDNI